MAYEDTIWDAGFRAGRQDAQYQADKLAFALQELLVLAADEETDPKWLLHVATISARKFLDNYNEENSKLATPSAEETP